MGGIAKQVIGMCVSRDKSEAEKFPLAQHIRRMQPYNCLCKCEFKAQ